MLPRSSRFVNGVIREMARSESPMTARAGASALGFLTSGAVLAARVHGPTRTAGSALRAAPRRVTAQTRTALHPIRCCASTPGGAPAQDGDDGDKAREKRLDAAFAAFDDIVETGFGSSFDEDESMMSPRERRALKQERERAFRKQELERRLDALTALPDDLVVKQYVDKCPGCGSRLQSENERLPGFLPMEIREQRAMKIMRGEAVKSTTAPEAGMEANGDASSNGRVFPDTSTVGSNDPVQDNTAQSELVGDGFTATDAESKKTLDAAGIRELQALLKGDGIDVLSMRKESMEPKSEEDKAAEAVCQRCYRLSHYGAIDPELRVQSPRRMLEKRTDEKEKRDRNEQPAKRHDPPGKRVLTPATFRKNLEQLQSKSAVVIYLVDVFDFHGTFLPGLRDLVGNRCPIILAVNKVDLLPERYKPDRVERWITQETKTFGLTDVDSVHFISSKRGTGLRTLLADALTLARKRRADIYVVGAANVGKSSFINQLMERRLKKSGKSKDEAPKKRHKRRTGALTTSVIPGTTLDVIRIPLHQTVSLYDTPGIIVKHQLTNSLDAEELRAVLPTKAVEKATLRLGEGKALFLGALARIDIVEGRPFFFTTFVSSDVKVHPGRSEEAEEFTRKHVGELLTPPFSATRLEELGEWSSKSFTAHGAGWERACIDIVLSGLGWVSLTGVGPIRVKISAPRGVGVFTREPLMPFEVRSTGVGKYTGTRTVNTRELAQAERRRKARRYAAEDADYFAM